MPPELSSFDGQIFVQAIGGRLIIDSESDGSNPGTFSFLNTDGAGRCMQRHRHQEFIRFLNAVEKTVPATQAMHVILDNYAATSTPKVIAWLA